MQNDSRPDDLLTKRIAELEAQLAEAQKDSERLEELERLVEANMDGGLLLHHQTSPVAWRGLGIGLSFRTLRAALDDFRGAK